MRFREFFKAFIFPIIVFFIHLFLFYFNFYLTFTWLDIPMHFLGGFAMAFTYFSLVRILQREGYLGKMHPFILFLFIISLVTLIAVLWEFAEFIADFFLNASVQMGLVDTMLDFFMGLVGGAFGFFFRYKLINLSENFF